VAKAIWKCTNHKENFQLSILRDDVSWLLIWQWLVS